MTPLLRADPERTWSTHELAQHLGDITLYAMYRQLIRWTTSGHIHKIDRGRYTAQKSAAALA
jgi:hypothetical protein